MKKLAIFLALMLVLASCGAKPDKSVTISGDAADLVDTVYFLAGEADSSGCRAIYSFDKETMEITAEDGQVYTLLKSQVGDVLEDVAAKLESGDQVSLRLSRKGSILEIAEGDQVHLAFDASIKKAVGDVIVSAVTAVVFDLLAVVLLLRAWVLKLNRKSSFRFGPAR